MYRSETEFLGGRLFAAAAPGGDLRARFGVWAPLASEVLLHFAEGETARAMTPGEHGVFFTETCGMSSGCDYFFSIDRGPPRPDPRSRFQPQGVHGPSRLIDPDAYQWQDSGWQGRRADEYIVYELHVGTASESGTFAGAAELLPYLAELGITAVELMPVAQFPGARNWGYDGVNLFAPHNTYGGPDGLKRFVDAAHSVGIAVLLDVVYNHLGPEGNYLAEFGPYFTERHKTPWGAALNFDDAYSDHVRAFILDNAKYWVQEYHIDGLRLDAVHAIYDFSAYHILEELADELHGLSRELGRPVTVIAESDLNDPRLIRPKEQGGYGLDGHWNDDFHHAVHALLTGESAGYYADFGSRRALCKAFEQAYVHDGGYSGYRKRRHGRPPGDAAPGSFVVFIQNHDQVGNRASGDRLSVLVDPPKRRLAAALLLFSPYVPLLFMGEEYGEDFPFLYFVDHLDPDLRKAVSEGRKREFSAFGWEGEIPDPAGEEAYIRSRPDFSKRALAHHRPVYQWYASLISLRQNEPALAAGAARSVGLLENGRLLYARCRHGDEPELIAAFNLSGEQAAEEITLPWDGWRKVTSSTDPSYLLPGEAPEPLGSSTPGSLIMPPYSAALFREERRQ